MIDLGTNSVRFDIHEVIRPGMLRSVYREKAMVRLGQDVFTSHKLSDEAVNRTLSALRLFKKKMNQYDADHVVSAATSAVREAKNGKAFLKHIRSELSLDIELITGKREAELILKGILAFEPMVRDSVGFVDIGGGSTEAGVCRDGEIFLLESFEVGAARLKQKYIGKMPSASELDGLRAEIRGALGSRLGFKDWPKLGHLFGASGTVKAITRIMRECGYGESVSKRALKELIENMSSMHERDLIMIPGMEERRTDIILSGAIILEEFMDFFSARTVYRTRYALREGLLQEKLEQLGYSESRSEFESQVRRIEN